MPQGPGKYDEICEFVRDATKAEAVLICVVNGNKGDGFSVTGTNWMLVLELPRMLRKMAQEIEDSFPHA
jgi:hypothetical protein